MIDQLAQRVLIDLADTMDRGELPGISDHAYRLTVIPGDVRPLVRSHAATRDGERLRDAILAGMDSVNSRRGGVRPNPLSRFEVRRDLTPAAIRRGWQALGDDSPSPSPDLSYALVIRPMRTGGAWDRGGFIVQLQNITNESTPFSKEYSDVPVRW